MTVRGQFLSKFNSVLTHLNREYIKVHFGCYRPLTFKAKAQLFKKPMYPLNYKRNGMKHTFVEGQCVNNLRYIKDSALAK